MEIYFQEITNNQSQIFVLMISRPMIIKYFDEFLEIQLHNLRHEILSQFVYEYFGDRLYDSPYRFSPTPQNQIQLRDRVNYLKEVPQPEQRTSEWYTYREGRITASDAAAIWNQNPFCEET